jgi:hypothetical protein
MVTKRVKKSTKKVKNLPAKSVASAQEKKVRGGEGKTFLIFVSHPDLKHG